MSQALKAAAARLEHWLRDQALPLWLERGIDPISGANHECLTPAGQPDLEANLRVRVQARQAFFYAAAYCRGWCDSGRVAAEGIWAFVRQKAAHPVAGFSLLLNPCHQVIDKKQDLYDHAFFLLAYAWSFRAFGDAYYLREADKLIAHLDARFGSVQGGWIEGDYAYECRRQNPHMHLFEAFLALYDASGNAKYLARAGEIFALFQTRFFDAEAQVLFEFFDDDWTRLAGIKGEQVEPGHLMEWVWLLDWYSRCTGHPVQVYRDALYNKGLAIGMAPSGLLYDAVKLNGEIIDPNKRCWGMTELIKASLVQLRAGDQAAEAVAIKAVDDLFKYYLCAATPGAYVDKRDAQDELLVDLAPASTLYHLIVAAMELVDHVNSYGASQD